MLSRRMLGGAAALLAGALASSPAQAQFPIGSGPPLSMGSPVVTASPAPVVADRGIRYALPLGSEARRKARTVNRYTVARPVYAGRPGVTFSPYSDYYFPRTIGAKETVYTTSPGGSVPVGEAAFRRPAPVGVPVFPR